MQSEEESDVYEMDDDNQNLLALALQNDDSEEASSLIEKGSFFGENFHYFLYMAIDKNNYRILKILIDHGVQYNQSIDFKSLLYKMMFQGNPLMIEAILPHCRFSKPSDQYIPRELVIAPNSQHKDCVELLLEWNFTINPNSYHDEDFIYGAFENGYLPIVIELLNFGIDVNMVNSETGLNLLTIACLNKHHGVVEKLLEHNADVNGRISSMNESLNKNSCFKHHISKFNSLFFHYDHKCTLIDVTCLHIAVFNSDPLMIDILFKHGVKILDNLKLFNLTSYAVYNNYEEIVRIFLDHGVNVENTDRRRNSLLHFCVNWCHYERDYCYNVAKLLLEKGANIHLKTPNNQLVYDAISREHRKTTRLFLDYDADVQYIDSKPRSLLHIAIEIDFDPEIIKTLLKLNAPVNTKDMNGHPPLYLAFNRKSNNTLEIVKALLRHDADIHYTDDYLRTTLHLACENSLLEIVTLFLKRGISPHVRDGGGNTPLHYVCTRKGESTGSIIKLLLEYGAVIETVTNIGWTPLLVACEAGNDAAVKCLLDHHANPHVIVDKGQTALHVACYNSNDMAGRVIELLLGCGLNIEARDGAGYTPLFKACLMHGEYAVECLLDNNAIPSATDYEGRTPLHSVCSRLGDKTDCIVKLLLQHGANINAVDQRGWTPLFFACGAGDDTLRCLVDNHANPNNANLQNTIPLHIVMKIYDEYSHVVDILLNYNVNVHHIDNHRKSVIHHIAESWYMSDNIIKLVTKFASMDVDFNSVDNDGNTPLHIAVKKCSDIMIENLIKYGANINILNKNNKTPIEEAMEIFRPLIRSPGRLERETIVMLIAQVVKLKVAGLKVHQQNLDILYDSDNGKLTPKKDFNFKVGPFDVEQVEVECQREIERMKKERIGIDNLTIYDFLTNHAHLLRVRSKIQTIRRKVDREIYNKKPPLYFDIFKSRIREAAVRYRRNQLMDSARNCFRLNISQRLPDECIDMIWDYLNIGELEMFIQTIKTLEVTQPSKSSEVAQHQRKSTRKRQLTSFKNM